MIDNLISKLSRVHIDPRSFKGDDGRTVNYAPLVLTWTLPGGASYAQEVKITKETRAIIDIAATVKTSTNLLDQVD